MMIKYQKTFLKVSFYSLYVLDKSLFAFSTHFLKIVYTKHKTKQKNYIIRMILDSKSLVRQGSNLT